MKKRKVIKQTAMFTLVMQTRNHKKWFEILVDLYYPEISWEHRENLENEIRAYFNRPPRGNSSGLSWRFWNREEAEKHLTFLIIRYS